MKWIIAIGVVLLIAGAAYLSYEPVETEMSQDLIPSIDNPYDIGVGKAEGIKNVSITIPVALFTYRDENGLMQAQVEIPAGLLDIKWCSAKLTEPETGYLIIVLEPCIVDK